MKIIDSPETMALVLASSHDSLLERLLRLRVEQLTGYEGYEPYDLATFAIVEPPDRLEDIEATLCLPITTNLVDGSRYGESAFVPSAEWIADHGGLFEMVYVLSDDGAGIAIFVPDRDGIDPVLLNLCREFAGSSSCD